MKIQPIRLRRDIKDYHIQEEIELIKKIAKTEKMSISEVLETINILEYRRRTDIMIDNFDTFDENISGIDESLIEIAEAINEKTNN
jgi:hypothetical protein